MGWELFRASGTCLSAGSALKQEVRAHARGHAERKRLCWYSLAGSDIVESALLFSSLSSRTPAHHIITVLATFQLFVFKLWWFCRYGPQAYITWQEQSGASETYTSPQDRHDAALGIVQTDTRSARPIKYPGTKSVYPCASCGPLFCLVLVINLMKSL